MLKKAIFAILLTILFFNCQGQTQKKYTSLIDSLLNTNSEYFETILKNPEMYEIQILYTQIDRDSLNNPHFKQFKYNLNPKQYFYPASSIKLPVTVLALEKLNNLQLLGLGKYTALKIDSSRSPQTKVSKDTSSAMDGLPTIANYIKKVFLVSDNDAFNRLYEFLGQKYINETLWKKGFKDVKITHRLANSKFTEEDNRYTNPITFYNKNKIIYAQSEAYNSKYIPSKIGDVFKGKGYYDDKTKDFVDEPKDFTSRNYISIQELQEILKTIIFPESVEASKRFNLTKEDYRFLYQCMSEYPDESKHPTYNDKTEDFCKYLMFGNTKDDIPKNIRIFNKIGMAYGFMIDNAYIVDFERKVEFLLTVVVYVNKNQIFNDDIYEYTSIGYPFLRDLGRVIFWHEAERKKKYMPDLTKFKVNYD